MHAGVGEVALGFKTGGATLTGRGDRLAIDMIRHVPRGKQSGRLRRRSSMSEAVR